jgi:probable phosphoglycerate mutase
MIAPGSVELVVVRHGETQWSAEGRHTSWTDVDLTDEGRRQAERIRVRLAGDPISAVLVSPSRRAIETCQLVGLARHAESCPDLAEWNYGDYEGRRSDEIRREVPGWTVFTHAVPGGETLEAVVQRAERVIARAAALGGRVALFSHGHILRVLAARWVGLDGRFGACFALAPGTISRLDWEREQAVIRRWNA